MTHKTHHTLRKPKHTHILRWNGNSFCVAWLSNKFDFSFLEGKWKKLKVELRIYLESFICWKQLVTVKPFESISITFLWGRRRKSHFATADIPFIICIRYSFSSFSNFPSQQWYHLHFFRQIFPFTSSSSSSSLYIFE